MKKRFLMIWMILLLLTGCGGVAPLTLQETNAIPEDGMISAKLLGQIREENAIAVFRGESSGFSYEWTIFGTELPADVSPVDLRVYPAATEGGMEIRFAQSGQMGFPALLSLHLNELWDAQGAVVYRDGTVVGTASLTGTKNTTLNLTILDATDCLQVRPEAERDSAAKEPEEVQGTVFPDTGSPVVKDEYLSQTGSGDTKVYGESQQPQEVHQEEPVNNVRDEYLSAETSGSGQVYGAEENAAPVWKSESAGKAEDYLSGVKNEASQVYGELDGPVKPVGSSQTKPEDYLSAAGNSTGRVYSDGLATERDPYFTDPVPEGKPIPVEPEDQDVNKGKAYTCRFSIECSTILNNLAMLDSDKLEMVPFNGTILPAATVTFYEGESVFDVLQRVCRENGIHMESSWTPVYNSAYVEGIHNLYEFDCGNLSGWMYRVNGWYPNYGCSRYQLQQDDVVEWRYTCDLGNDVGRGGTW